MNHVAIKKIPQPPSSVEIKPGYTASMKLILSLPTIMSKCCFFTFFNIEMSLIKEILNKSNKCRDVQYSVTLVMCNQGKVT